MTQSSKVKCEEAVSPQQKRVFIHIIEINRSVYKVSQ